MKSLYASTICFCLVIASVSASAGVLSKDWLAPGDNLITEDTVTGLEWLDLTETNNMTQLFVSGEFGPGGAFEGFRYATNAEVIALWSNFGIDLNAGGTEVIAGHDPGVATAASFLGNILNEKDPVNYPDGSLGITDQTSSVGFYNLVGAFTFITGSTYRYVVEDHQAHETTVDVDTGSYLVRSVAAPVPSVGTPGLAALIVAFCLSGILALTMLKRPWERAE